MISCHPMPLSHFIPMTGEAGSEWWPEQILAIDRLSLHKHAETALPRGARYEIRQTFPRVGEGKKAVFDRGWYHDENMDAEPEWQVGDIIPPVDLAEAGYLLYGKYIVSLCGAGACFGGRLWIANGWHRCPACKSHLNDGPGSGVIGELLR